MGRTISIDFKKEGNAKFTDKEIDMVVSVANKYNSGKFAKVWSCDSFYPRPINTIVNWNGNKGMEIKMILRRELNDGNGYDWENYMEGKTEELLKGNEIIMGKSLGEPYTYNKEKKKFTRMEAARFFVKEGWLQFGDNKIGESFHEFVKVQGNEFNAMLVFTACKELSMLIPKMEIDIKDEGEFLLCPIRMSCGRAIPLLSILQENMEHMALKMLFSKGFKGNILNKLVHKPKEFTHEFRMNHNLENGYGDMTKYINERLRNIKEVETRLLPHIKENGSFGRSELYLENLENRPKEKGWFDAELFTRIADIKVRDFLTYKMTPATIMDGFHGEYFKLTSEDAESTSYKRIAQLQKVFEKLGVNGVNMEVLGETKK